MMPNIFKNDPKTIENDQKRSQTFENARNVRNVQNVRIVSDFFLLPSRPIKITSGPTVKIIAPNFTKNGHQNQQKKILFLI